jgi:hypothetical protein
VAVVAFLAGTAAGAAVAVPATLALLSSGGPPPGSEAVARRGPDKIARDVKPTGAPSQGPAAKGQAPTKAGPPPAATTPAAERPYFPAAAPPRTGPADPLARPVLKESDFEYLGAFAFPPEACKVSTAFGGTGLALRKVGGKRQFLTGTGRPSRDLIYEVSFPGLGKDFTNTGSNLPRADLVKEWGNIYRGEAEGISGYVAYGLYWDEAAGGLYWSRAPYYNATHANVPSLGYTELTDKGPVTHGPWATGSYIQKIRGGCLRLPDYFAKRYTKGRTLALGFGGSYCIIVHGSFGPCLWAVPEPRREGETLDALPLLDFEAVESEKGHHCRRDADYHSGIPWDKNPVGGVGFWTAADYINGACCWIDLPDKHGLLVLGRMGHGRVFYGEPEGGGDKGIHSERSEPWWYVFNPADLAAVARGEKQPYDPVPSWWKCKNTGTSTTGCCFEAETRTLYILEASAWKRGDSVEWYPVVHGYRVK